MKLLNVKGSLHLSTFDNPKGAKAVRKEDKALPLIPPGFSLTACGRVYGGGELSDESVALVNCPSCRGTTDYEQAQVLQSMMDED